MIWKIVGITVFLESILSSKRIDWPWPTIKVGEFDKISNNSKFWSRIHFGGLINDTMVSCGTSTTTELIWSKLWVVLKESLSTHCLREPTSPLGKVSSGRRQAVLRSPWDTRNWHTHNVQVSIRSLIEDLHSGGLPQSTELTFTLASRCNWI